MNFQVSRKIIHVEYGTVEADSHAQAADLLRAGMWGDVVSPVRDKETVRDEVNGVPVGDHTARLIAAGRAADDDLGEDLSHLTPDGMVKKLSD